MKNRLLKAVALLLVLATTFAAAACRSGSGGASSDSGAREIDSGSETGCVVNDDGLYSVSLDPYIDNGIPTYAYAGPDGVLENLRPLYTLNPDIVGWLTVKNGNGVAFIDYPVVQSYDNNFYLRRSFFGGYASGGTVFMHYRCNAVDLSKNTVIFGHNLKDHTLFAQLLKYASASFCNSAPIIEYSTLYNVYKFKVFAAFYTTIQFDYIQPSFDNLRDFNAIVGEARARSMVNTNVEVDSSDSIITLSTCAYVTGVDGARFVVMGRLLREGESAGGVVATDNTGALDIRQGYRYTGS